MPAILPEILECVVYLYPDEESARAGKQAGGSGCLVVIPVQDDPLIGFMYIVTNSHVIREGKASAIRVNTKDGGMAVVHLTQSGWIHHPDGDDIAILPINLEYEQVKAKGIVEKWFITKEKMDHFKIGPGDETFMVGRFVNHEGRQQNNPAVRFGNVSMMPNEPIRTGRGLLQEVFLVETRSLPGYSGSPVFIFPAPYTVVQRPPVPPMFLGIDMGHINDRGRVLDKTQMAQGKKVPIDDNWIVETNTGMSCVIPAWKIREVMYVDELVASRKQVLQDLEKEKNNSVVSFDTAGADEQVFTKSDFEAALTKVTRKN